MNAQLEAVQLQDLAVGRCGECHRFRNNMRWSVENKNLCSECFLLLRNKNTITAIKPAPKNTITPRKTQVKKHSTNSRKDKINKIYGLISESDYIQIKKLYEFVSRPTVHKYLQILEEQGKVKTVKVNNKTYISTTEKTEILYNFKESNTKPKKYIPVEERLLVLLNESDKPMSLPEILTNGFTKDYCYITLNKLVREGKIVKQRKNKINYYADCNEKHLPTEADTKSNKVKKTAKIRKTKSLDKASKEKLEIVLKIIQESKTILDSSVFDGRDFCRVTGMRAVESLTRKGLVFSSNYVRGQRIQFCDAGNPELVKQIEEINNSQTHSKIVEFLQSTDRYQSINDIIRGVRGVNKKRWGGGTYRYFKKVIEQIDCEVITNKVGSYYRLRK